MIYAILSLLVIRRNRLSRNIFLNLNKTLVLIRELQTYIMNNKFSKMAGFSFYLTISNHL